MIKRWLIEKCAEADCCQLSIDWNYDTSWNPLKNDHDAFQMMAYCGLNVRIYSHKIDIGKLSFPNGDLSSDGTAELRRAIVMAVSNAMNYRDYEIWIEWDGNEYIGGFLESEYSADDFFVLYSHIKTMIDKAGFDD